LKRIFFVTFSLVLLVAVATPKCVSADGTDTLKEARLRLLAGYRTDDLDWNIADDINGENPNILSELTWKDLNVWQLQAEGNVDIANDTFPWFSIYLKGMAGYGWIIDGRNRDSDYATDGNSIEESRSINDADDGSVLDLSIAIGPHLSSKDSCWSIIPLLGYSYHEQRLTMTDGQQIIPPSGAFDGLDSTYETEWSGPWIGVDIAYLPVSKWTFTANIEYHWVDYSAEADWNLRDDFQHPKSFEHEADGDGWAAGVGVNYSLNEHLSVGLNGDYLSWKADSGIDRLYLENGSVVDTRLNEVNWKSTSLSVSLDWAF
jgi:hypothetical protein